MPRPCTSRAMSTSATLSAMSCVTLLLSHLKSPLALSAERSPQLTSAVTNSHFIRARRPGQLAYISIYWNSESDETFQCLRQSFCFRPDPAITPTSCSPHGPVLSLLPPARLGFTGLSQPHIAVALTVDYLKGPGKLLGSLMCWGRLVVWALIQLLPQWK